MPGDAEGAPAPDCRNEKLLAQTCVPSYLSTCALDKRWDMCLRMCAHGRHVPHALLHVIRHVYRHASRLPFRHAFRHAFRHVFRHAYRHVFRHAFRHAYRHVYRHAFRHAYMVAYSYGRTDAWMAAMRP